jgi:hypothetical protein
MKTIIAGCRDHFEWKTLIKAVLQAEVNGIVPTAVICGRAPGVDETGYWFAKMARLPIIEEPADWDRYGKAAGPFRNFAMAQQAEALIAVWDGKSPGTENMIGHMKARGLPYHVEMIPWPK